MTEVSRIAQLLEQTFEGKPYYGPSVLTWETAKGDKSRKIPTLLAVAKAIGEQATAMGRTQFSTESLWDQSD